MNNTTSNTSTTPAAAAATLQSARVGTWQDAHSSNLSTLDDRAILAIRTAMRKGDPDTARNIANVIAGLALGCQDLANTASDAADLADRYNTSNAALRLIGLRALQEAYPELAAPAGVAA